MKSITILLFAFISLTSQAQAETVKYNRAQSRDLFRTLALNPEIVTDKQSYATSSASYDGKTVHMSKTDVLSMTTNRTSMVCSRTTMTENGKAVHRTFSCTTDTKL